MLLVFLGQTKFLGHTLVGIDQGDKAYDDDDEVEQSISLTFVVFIWG